MEPSLREGELVLNVRGSLYPHTAPDGVRQLRRDGPPHDLAQCWHGHLLSQQSVPLTPANTRLFGFTFFYQKLLIFKGAPTVNASGLSSKT